ncbi:MAG TPA: hypothetical protein VLI39_11585 [Sedimentisphaerales bacterium]|nr:hypothetical protein [Sedimentisphaerales bacterium]
MNRRRFIAAGAMGLGALVAGPLRHAVAAGRKDRPNIVWLVTEDNSARWLRLYDENGAPMPNIERLAAQGLARRFMCPARSLGRTASSPASIRH